VNNKIIVKVDPELEDLIPGFLSNRRNDVVTIRALVADGDFDTVRLLGHSMKGAGGGYGFDPITDLGGVIEEAALKGNVARILDTVSELEDYLARVEPSFS
jgi:Hpt domain